MNATTIFAGLVLLCASAEAFGGRASFTAGKFPFVVINRDRAPKAIVIDRYLKVLVALTLRSDGTSVCSVVNSSGRSDLDAASCGLFRGSVSAASIEPNYKDERRLIIAWVPENSEVTDTDAAIAIGAEHWITADDLALLAVHGTIRAEYSFNVKTDGRISNCQAVRSNAKSAFDSAVCELLTKSSLFIPARDSNGLEVESIGHRRINYISSR